MYLSLNNMKLQDEYNSNKRILWLDLARVIALLSISLNHAVDRAVNVGDEISYLNNVGFSFTAIFYTIVYFFSRLGVPLFLMITGALIINKKIDTYSDVIIFYKNNLLKLLITSELWIAIMYWIIIISKLPGYDIPNKFSSIIVNFIATLLFNMNYTYGNMWYIPMILAIYIILPCFSIAINKVGIKIFIIPFFAVLTTGMLIPNFNELLEILRIDYVVQTDIVWQNIFSIYMLYILIGYCISQGLLKKVHSNVLITLFVLLFAFSIIYIILYSNIGSHYDISYYHIYTLLVAALLFEILRRYGNLVKQYSASITYLSKISFAIYFMHIILMEFMRYSYDFNKLPHIVSLLILEIVPILLSILFIVLLSRNKYLRKYLLMIR